MLNPFSGRNATGFRFRFHIRKISNRPLYLPIEMKDLPEIKALLAGMSPLDAFGVKSLDLALRCFRALRKKFDFDYWAVNEFFIRDMEDPDSNLPLVLNDNQHYVIDIMRKRYSLHQHGRYIISKSLPKCGLSTCIQAFILWLQTCVRSKNSYTCSHNDLNNLHLKDNLFRYLKRDGSSDANRIHITCADSSSFFNTFRNPDGMRGIDFGYIHLSDMSKWLDPSSKFTSRAYIAAISGVLPDYFSIIVLEGNTPKCPTFSLDKELSILPRPSEAERKTRFRSICRNPFFLNNVVVANDYPSPYLHHINLDFPMKSPFPI